MSYGYPPPPQQPGQEPGRQPQQPPQWGQQPPPPYQQWPQQGPGWGAPPPRKSNTGLIVTLSVVGGLVLLGGCGALVAVTVSHAPKPRTLPMTEAPQDKAPGKDESSEDPAVEEGGPEADVKVTRCGVDSLTTWPDAVVEIVNHGDSKATYVVNVDFVDDSGTRLGKGLAATDTLAVGQKVTEKAQGLVKVPGKVTCKVSKVTRYPTN